jgi:hypothetical protein
VEQDPAALPMCRPLQRHPGPALRHTRASLRAVGRVAGLAGATGRVGSVTRLRDDAGRASEVGWVGAGDLRLHVRRRRDSANARDDRLHLRRREPADLARCRRRADHDDPAFAGMAVLSAASARRAHRWPRAACRPPRPDDRGGRRTIIASGSASTCPHFDLSRPERRWPAPQPSRPPTALPDRTRCRRSRRHC